MKRWIAILGVGLAGCGSGGMLGGQSGENSPDTDDPCLGATYEAATLDDDQLGFTARQVLEGLPTPTGVVWERVYEDLAWEGSDEPETLEIAVGGLVGEVQIGDFTEAYHDCQLHERGLLIPVARTIRIGDGEVVGVGTTELFATGTDPSEIVTRTWGQNPSAELSGRYQEAHDAWWAQAQQRLKALDDPEGWEIDTISLGVGGRWDALKVGIVGQYVNVASGAGYGQSLWSGDATWPDDEY